MNEPGRSPKADSDPIERGSSSGERETGVAPRDAATQSFIRGVIERGEAGHYDADGNLPLRYKYAIVGTHPDGLPIIKRVRT